MSFTENVVALVEIARHDVNFITQHLPIMTLWMGLLVPSRTLEAREWLVQVEGPLSWLWMPSRTLKAGRWKVVEWNW